MARLEELLTQVEDGPLRGALADEVQRLKREIRFGLVFERHIPETILLGGSIKVRVGDRVRLREAGSKETWEVIGLGKQQATIAPVNGSEDGAATSKTVDVSSLFVIRDFSDPIYPTLESIGAVNRSTERPYHAVINGENFDALQLLLYAAESQVDCIYIDPPYNTGARDWKYNNDYVDRNDSFRHSKWLSFMERRLKLAKRLLKADGVLIVTIDDNELHHLGVLLETLFPDARRQLVTIVINPAGAGGDEGGLDRVEEYAFFVFLGGAEPAPTEDDMLVAEGSDGTETAQHGIRWERLMRGGNAWYRASRPNLCYPVLLDKDRTRIVRAGEPLEGDEAKRPQEVDGHPVAWPTRTDGRLGIWRVEAARLNWLNERGYAQVTSPPDKEHPTLRYLLSGTVDRIEAGGLTVIGKGDRGQVLVEARTGLKTAKTVWYRGRHTGGGGGGTGLLSAFLGQRDVFSYPKSLYSVRDCLEVALGNRPEGVVLDFFAGSGTTLHATALLNRKDGGKRRCVLVTNNEVDDKTARKLNKAGHAAGDPEFESHGIFQATTRKRVEAALTGVRPDGTPIPTGKGHRYLDGTPWAEGFEENVEFFNLRYLDPDDVELGRSFDALHPLLWLRAGAKNQRPTLVTQDKPFHILEDAGYAVVFDERSLREFVPALNETPGVDQVFIVTDSEDAFAEMCVELGLEKTTHMLYRGYLRTFTSFARTRS